METRNIKYIHFAPPCGTASRAREMQRTSGPNPMPLRSDEFPDGLPHLGYADALRVHKDNELYKFVAEACLRLVTMGIFWTIENPGHSLMWQTKAFAAALYSLAIGSQECSSTCACMEAGVTS